MDEPFIGQICPFGFNFAPRNWAFCAGALIAINDNQSLFSLLGTNFGGDGRTSFGLPDLRGRTSMGQGQHPGSAFDWRLGQDVGSETYTLTIPELANHTHAASFTPGGGDTVADVQVSTDAATQDLPTEGSYLATNSNGGTSPGVLIYRPDEGSGTVTLGGVSGGSGLGGRVDLQSEGGSNPFLLFQPSLVINYCISLDGLYPPRS